MITIHNWIKRERPIVAEFCELINSALQNKPNMSLAEFAVQLDEANKETTYARLLKAEKEQFGRTE